jgi:hypothetical protein
MKFFYFFLIGFFVFLERCLFLSGNNFNNTVDFSAMNHAHITAFEVK